MDDNQLEKLEKYVIELKFTQVVQLSWLRNVNLNCFILKAL